MRDKGAGLIEAAARLLRPLVKRILAAGIPFGLLEAKLREVFVEVAEREFALPGRRQTDSRISLVTGINRKEVRRLRSADQRSAPRSFTMNHATSLISRWRTDPQTSDRSGRPLSLPYQAERGPSFTKLARKVTADLAPRILLDELVRNGAAEITREGAIVVRGESYVPHAGAAEQLEILGEDPAELIETILRNVIDAGDERLLQRKVFFDNLGSESAARVRAEVRREGERFLRRMNKLLARHDRDRNPKAAGGDRYYAGVGIYFFDASPPGSKAEGGRGGGSPDEKE